MGKILFIQDPYVSTIIQLFKNVFKALQLAFAACCIHPESKNGIYSIEYALLELLLYYFIYHLDSKMYYTHGKCHHVVTIVFQPIQNNVAKRRDL